MNTANIQKPFLFSLTGHISVVACTTNIRAWSSIVVIYKFLLEIFVHINKTKLIQHCMHAGSNAIYNHIASIATPKHLLRKRIKTYWFNSSAYKLINDKRQQNDQNKVYQQLNHPI